MAQTILVLHIEGTADGTRLVAATLTDEGFDDIECGDPPIWVARQERIAPARGNFASDWDGVKSLAAELLQGEKAAAIGISVCGVVEFAKGIVRRGDRLPGWTDIALRQEATEAFGAPATIDRAGTAGAIGEFRFGAGDLRDLGYAIVGNSISGGWLLNGMPWRGTTGLAGEIGHGLVGLSDSAGVEGQPCYCGRMGCLTRLAAVPYLLEDAAEGLGDRPTLEQLGAKAAAGDRVSQALLARAGRAVGTTLAQLSQAIGIDRFILGGAVPASGDSFWSAVREAAHQAVQPETQLNVLPSTLGEDAPLWGMAALARPLAFMDDGDF